MKKINIFTGHYGSGKTEIAINFALSQAKKGLKTVICDFDIVNPYFRTKDAQIPLEKAGITVICPEYANTNVDLPTLPAQIQSVFDRDFDCVVFDVGGDAEGAIALGTYQKKIKNYDYEMAIVINLKRPLTATHEDIVSMVRDIENSSRLSTTYFINNTNISYETTTDILLWHREVLDSVAKETNIPVLYMAGTHEVIKNLPACDLKSVLELSLYLNPAWLCGKEGELNHGKSNL